MVQVTQQIWDGGTSGLDRKERQSQVRQLAIEAEKTRSRIEAEVRGAMAKIKQQEQDASAATKALKVSQQALADAKAGFSAGAATEYEVRALEDRVVNAEIGVLQARTQLAVAILDLRQSVGASPM